MTFDDCSSLDLKGDKALLHLANDSAPIKCNSFGANESVSGEVVFNTGMVGYPEALTDPSYRGQILVLTYPLIGNYGVPDESVLDELGLPLYFESKDIHITGLVVSSYSWEHSHWAAQKSLGKWLTENRIPGVYGIDTRELTKNLREVGSMLGKIEINPTGSMPQSVPKNFFSDPNRRNLVEEVSTKEVITYGKGNSPKIIAYDCGMKYNILRTLVQTHQVELAIVPFDYDLEKNPSNLQWDGLFFV